MGRKRKHRDRDRDERILRKIRRLEKQVRRDSYDSLSSESRSDHENQSRWHTENENTYYFPHNDSLYEADVPQATAPPKSAVNSIVQENPQEIGANLIEKDQQAVSSEKTNQGDATLGEITHLDDEILTLLGDPPKEESPIGPDVHNDIASRLQDVLLNGLKKDIKEKLVEDYPVPGNCSFFNAPLLNAEVKAAISEILQKKDASLAARQRQVGTALTALVKSMDILVSDKSDVSQQVLKHVSSACRLLCDSHYIDTKLRRNFLISTLNNKLKDTLKESKRDKSLFGEDLAEKLKATKAITKTSQDLRYNKPRPVAAKNSASTNTQPNLNWKHPQPNHQSQNKRLAPPQRSAGGPSTSHDRSRADTDYRRRPPAPRARSGAHYSYKRRP